MKYNVSKNYEEQGPYGVMQIRALLKSGKLDGEFYVETSQGVWIPLPDFLAGRPKRARKTRSAQAPDLRASGNNKV